MRTVSAKARKRIAEWYEQRRLEQEYYREYPEALEIKTRNRRQRRRVEDWLMRNVGKERAKQLRQYSKRLKPWLKENTHCRACLVIAGYNDVAIRTIRLADECHHMRGRNGDLLLDERYWLPVCMGCHRWITEHGKVARKLGLSADVNYRTI